MSIFLWVCKDASRNACCCYWEITIASCASDDVISSVGENTSRYLSLTSSKSFLTLLHATFRTALSAYSSGVMWNSHSSFDEDSSSIFCQYHSGHIQRNIFRVDALPVHGVMASTEGELEINRRDQFGFNARDSCHKRGFR